MEEGNHILVCERCGAEFESDGPNDYLPYCGDCILEDVEEGDEGAF